MIGCWLSWHCATRGNCTERTERVELNKQGNQSLAAVLCVLSATMGLTIQRKKLPTWAGKATVHVGPIPRLHSAIYWWQRAKHSLASQRRDHDDWLLLPVLVLPNKPHPWPQAWTNHTGLGACHWKEGKEGLIQIRYYFFILVSLFSFTFSHSTKGTLYSDTNFLCKNIKFILKSF